MTQQSTESTGRRTAPNDQQPFRQFVEFPFEQGLRFQRTAAQLLLNGLEAGSAAQQRGLELTRESVDTYLATVEDLLHTAPQLTPTDVSPTQRAPSEPTTPPSDAEWTPSITTRESGQSVTPTAVGTPQGAPAGQPQAPAAPMQSGPTSQLPPQQYPVTQQLPVQQAPVQQAPVQQASVQQSPPVQPSPPVQHPTSFGPPPSTLPQQTPPQQIPAQQAPPQQIPAQQAPPQQTLPQQAPPQRVPPQQTLPQQAPPQQAQRQPLPTLGTSPSEPTGVGRRPLTPGTR